MRDLYLSEMLLAKEALEKRITPDSWTVKNYHADNFRFSKNGFIDAINQKYQKITFFVVGVHHQNGIVENKNKIMTTGARTLLLHVMIIWPQMIDKMFWGFSVKSISERLNSL